MSGHPVLTTTVYVIIAVVFVAVVLYMILYNRSVKAKQVTLEREGHLPVSPQEGIAIATEEKERTGRTGSIT